MHSRADAASTCKADADTCPRYTDTDTDTDLTGTDPTDTDLRDTDLTGTDLREEICDA